jgi:hypothetical protein
VKFWIRCGAAAPIILAAALLAAVGLFLALVVQSGERGVGVVLLLVAAGMVAAMIYLVRSPATLGGRSKIFALAAVLVGASPLAALAIAALVFVGMPLATRTPFIDWSIVLVGLLFAVGGVCVAILGWERLRSPSPAMATQPSPPPRLREAAERPFDWNEDVRVTRV